jgi:hypothetical protein
MTDMTRLEDLCPDFPEWPERWMGVDKDLPYGEPLLAVIRPFAEDLIARGLKRRTIQRHLEYLWLLGGEIIRDVGMDDQYDIPPVRRIREAVGLDGGPYCRHLYSEQEMHFFDVTCRKLHKFLEQNDPA